MTDRVLVMLNVAPGLEEAIVDWLLGRGGNGGFTSGPVFGHGSEGQALSIAEQVTGRRRRLRFEVSMQRSECGAFLDEAAERFGTADIHITVLPVLAAGAPAAAREAFVDKE